MFAAPSNPLNVTFCYEFHTSHSLPNVACVLPNIYSTDNATVNEQIINDNQKWLIVKSLISRFPNQWWYLILGWPPSPVSNENVKLDLEMYKTGEYTQSDISDIEFTDYEMAEAMDELSTYAAPGPDGFLAILLKKCCNALAPSLARIWCKSMSNGEIPDICKSATIIPIHKGKSRAVPKNYWPVALTSHLIKIFEKVVRKQIVEFMQANDLFNYSQHGLRGGRSSLSQLLCHFDRITSELENGKGVDVVYLDFAKAFDKVDHGITLRKLKLLGIKGQLGRWICSFLTNRVQSVLVEGKTSKLKPVTSGVPQGSVLGPLLFLVLIGDIDKTVASSFLSSFADDTRVGKGIASEEDIHNLQADLEAFYQWSVDNNMTLRVVRNYRPPLPTAVTMALPLKKNFTLGIWVWLYRILPHFHNISMRSV